MIAALLLAAVAVGAICLLRWRLGLLLTLAVGFLQDPVRKLLPGKPVALVVAVAAFFTICVLGIFLEGQRLPFRRLARWYPGLAAPAMLLLVIIVLQTVHTLLTTANLVLAGIGLLAYLSPPIALLAGEKYALRFPDLRRWVLVYLAGALVVAVTVVVEYAGVESPLFTPIWGGLVHGAGGSVRMFNGILRTPETAAWHLAAGACLLATWTVAARTPRVRWLGGFGTAFLVAAVLLTGRRKMLGELALFAVLFALLVVQDRRGSSRILQLGAAALLAAILGAQLLQSGEHAPVGGYVERGLSVVADSVERLNLMTIGMFRGIVLRNGFFGAGAGTGAQGAQYFGGGVQLVGGAAEGGVGKVLAELGVPGLLVLLWLFVAAGRTLLRVARFARRAPAHEALRIYGLVAFLPANAAVFLTAHQVFGDPFVLIVLGLVTGSVLAYPRIWQQRQAYLERARRRAAATAAEAA